MLLQGSELAGYIKQRHFTYIQNLSRNSNTPFLAIVDADRDSNSQNEEVVSSKFIHRKQEYGEDIGVNVSLYQPTPNDLEDTIQNINTNPSIHGLLIQLPLPEDTNTDHVLQKIISKKDVDALTNSPFDAPTPTAILWLLSGHEIDWHRKTIGVIGQGRLVGAPLTAMLRQSNIEPLIADESTGNTDEILRKADIIVTATGRPRLIKSEQIQKGSIVIDAGSADENGSIVGDVDPSVYDREDITISPVPGGVGPLTVCALFDNLLRAFEEQSL